MNEKIAVVGSDIDLLDDISESSQELIGYFSLSDKGLSYPYLGDHTKIGSLHREAKIVVAVDDVKLRRHLWQEYENCITSYVSNSSRISKSAWIGSGVVIYPNVYVGGLSVISNLVKISVGAQVHHECFVGDFSVLAPKVLALGRVRISEAVFVGANASLAPGTQIGAGAIIGMSANVLKNVSEESVCWGNPARIIEQKS